MQHEKYDCKKSGHCYSGTVECCWLCDGGLFMCGICGQVEAQLADECPGTCAFCDERYDEHEFDPSNGGCAKFEERIK